MTSKMEDGWVATTCRDLEFFAIDVHMDFFQILTLFDTRLHQGLGIRRG